MFLTLCQAGQLVAYHTTRKLWSLLFPGFLGQIYTITLLSVLIRPRLFHEQQNLTNGQNGPEGDFPTNILTTLSPNLPTLAQSGTAVTASGSPALMCPNGEGEGGSQWSGASSSMLVTPRIGHSALTVLRCRACDGTGAEKTVGLLIAAGNGRAVDVVSVPRKSDDFMGFRTALMNLEEDLKESDMIEMTKKNG